MDYFKIIQISVSNLPKIVLTL